MEFLAKSSRSLVILSILSALVLILATSTEAAAVNKRSIVRRENSNHDLCRTNAVCGWEVYNPSTRGLLYYIASSCKCVEQETCIRTDDDITVPAYIYQCKDIRRRKTTRRPTTDTTAGPS